MAQSLQSHADAIVAAIFRIVRGLNRAAWPALLARLKLMPPSWTVRSPVYQLAELPDPLASVSCIASWMKGWCLSA